MIDGLQRLSGWELRLALFMAERQPQPFEWGKNCCASFAIAWVELLTGKNVWSIDWTDARGAQDTLKRVGGMREAWTLTLGNPSQNWRVSRRGDVGLLDINNRLCGVVCTGATFAGPGVDKLVHRPLRDVQMVWRIG